MPIRIDQKVLGDAQQPSLWRVDLGARGKGNDQSHKDFMA
jgi:hypothetical protein